MSIYNSRNYSVCLDAYNIEHAAVSTIVEIILSV